MFRKHTRRAAKAAFAISFGVALLIGTITAGSAGAAKATHTAKKPTIVLGTKNFTEEFILGYLYGEALQAKGFKVVYKGSFGSSELADTAIRDGKMNFYPEYTGIIALDLAQSPSAGETFPKTAAATWKYAKKYEEKHHLTLLAPTPFVDADTITMLRATATADGIKTISDIKKLGSFNYAGYPECQTRITCYAGLQQIYHLNNLTFTSLGSISVYTLLDQHQIDGGDGFTTDPQQKSKKYVTLVDNKHIFGFENVAPVVSQKLLKGSNGMLFEATCNNVSKLLTVGAMRAMDKAAYAQEGTPKTIAHAFLKANHLVK
jgi:osmoprotectant transport system substrate-binding protein